MASVDVMNYIPGDGFCDNNVDNNNSNGNNEIERNIKAAMARIHEANYRKVFFFFIILLMYSSANY